MRDFDLKKLQNKQLEILKEVDRICKKHSIEYFCTWGTTLGAIRHGGFIPWDDDIDISMKWTEYIRFEEICKSELNNKYFLQNIETDKYFWNPYNKIRINNTTSMDKRLTHLKCHWGIGIDIFPLVAIPNSKIARLKQKTITSIYKVLCYTPYILNINPNEGTTKAKVFKLIPTTIVKQLKKSLIINQRGSKLKKLLLKEITKYDFNGCNYCGEMLAEPYEKAIFKKSIFDESIIVPFEEFEVPIPKEYDEYLKGLYGDYMKLPDESQRGGHGDTIVDFDKSYTEYQKDL